MYFNINSLLKCSIPINICQITMELRLVNSVKCPYFVVFWPEFERIDEFGKNVEYQIFEDTFCCSRVLICGQTESHTAWTKLIRRFLQFFVEKAQK